jgi:hypothetical protein
VLHNEVNKTLEKPVKTEAEVLQYYSRIGHRGRSPVWTPEDFAEADWAARIQGIGIGLGIAAALGGIYWLSNHN